jgi:hypothetical protein
VRDHFHDRLVIIANRDVFISDVQISEAKRGGIAAIYPREWRETVSSVIFLGFDARPISLSLSFSLSLILAPGDTLCRSFSLNRSGADAESASAGNLSKTAIRARRAVDRGDVNG